MQKTGEGFLFHQKEFLPASDLERWVAAKAW
jgi:hypothetical protein